MGKSAVSLNPETFLEGGGLIDDVDVVVVSASFDMFDYNGKVVPGVPALKMELDADGDVLEQYWSMGRSEDWMPSDDGSQLVAVGSATGIKSSSNGGIFLKSLIDAGFPAEDLGDDITVLNGLQCHVIRVPAPARPGIKNKSEKKFEDTILVISEIKALPGEKKTPKGGKKKSAAKGKTKPKGKAASKKAAPEGDDDLQAKATGIILEILEEEGTIGKKQLPAKIFQVMKTDGDRNAVVKLAFDDDFLGEGPWEYEDGNLISA